MQPTRQAPAAMRAEIARVEKRLRLNPGNGELARRLAEVRAEYAEAKIADYISKVVDAAPPLTTEQRARLAALIAPQDAA